MKTLTLVFAFALTSTLAHADPRPPGGGRLAGQSVPPGHCRKVLMYLNKFSSAYQTVCNPVRPAVPLGLWGR